MTDCVALVPYFGGDSAAAPSPAAKRSGYLARTVASLEPLARVIIIGVCRPEDDIISGIRVRTRMLDCEPRFIPAALCRWAQDGIAGAGISHVYVTEADQVLHYDPAVLAAAAGTDYLVPHRLEELGPAGEGFGRGPGVSFDGREWVLPNGGPPGGDGFWHPDGLAAQYGGAFLAAAELFASVSFPDSGSQPVETVTGFAASAAGHALKTCAWERFFVEHLSGFDYHAGAGR